MEGLEIVGVNSLSAFNAQPMKYILKNGARRNLSSFGGHLRSNPIPRVENYEDGILGKSHAGTELTRSSREKPGAPNFPLTRNVSERVDALVIPPGTNRDSSDVVLIFRGVF